MIKLRIVNVDHYMSAPISGLDVTYSEFRGAPVKQVPVLRIFGSTDTGKKTCLHVHGVFPYIYVPYDGETPAGQLKYQLAASLDKALNISLGTSNSTRHHVYKIVHVAGRPFYGYHERLHQYFKILFYNPLIVKRASELLQNGAICNKVYQCHESHVPYILQFLIDYNLHGMSFIELSKVICRSENAYKSDVMEDANVDNVNNDSCENIALLPKRISYCELEADGRACDILNIKTSSDSIVANPGLAGIWAEEKARRKSKFGTSQITAEHSQPRTNVQPTLSEIMLKQNLKDAIELIRSPHFSGEKLNKERAKEIIPYPVESQENVCLVDASFVDSHTAQGSKVDHVSSPKDEFLAGEESVINEELVLSLSQAIDNEYRFGTQDCSLLLMMQSLVDRNGVEEVELLNETQMLGNKTVASSQQLFVNDCDIEEGSILAPSLEPVVRDEENEELESNDRVGLLEKEKGLHVSLSPGQNLSECGGIWDDTFWDNLDEHNIPQLDGAIDELDNNSNRNNNSAITIDLEDSSSISSNNNIENTVFNKTIPIGNNVDDEDDALDGLKNIFDQVDDNASSDVDDRFWSQDQEDKELHNEIFRENMNSGLTFNSDNIIGDDANSFTVDDVNDVSVNMDSNFNNVLMGDPSFTQEPVEASSEDFVYSNRGLLTTPWSSNDIAGSTVSKQMIYQNVSDKNYDSLIDGQRNKEMNLEFNESTSDSVLYPTSELLLSCINDEVGSTVTDPVPGMSSDTEVINDKVILCNQEVRTDSNKNPDTDEKSDYLLDGSSTQNKTDFKVVEESSTQKYSFSSSFDCNKCSNGASKFQPDIPTLPSLFRFNGRYLKLDFVIKCGNQDCLTEGDNLSQNMEENSILIDNRRRYKKIRQHRYNLKSIRRYNSEEVDNDIISKYYTQLENLKKILHQRESSTTVKPVVSSHWNDIDKEFYSRCNQTKEIFIQNQNEDENDFDVFLQKSYKKNKKSKRFTPDNTNKSSKKSSINTKLVNNLVKKLKSLDKIKSENNNNKSANHKNSNKNIFKPVNKKINNNINGKNCKKKISYSNINKNNNGLEKDIHICRTSNCDICNKKFNKNRKNETPSPKSKDKKLNKSPKLVIKKAKLSPGVKSISLKVKKSRNYKISKSGVIFLKNTKIYPCAVFLTDICNFPIKKLHEQQGAVFKKRIKKSSDKVGISISAIKKCEIVADKLSLSDGRTNLSLPQALSSKMLNDNDEWQRPLKNCDKIKKKLFQNDVSDSSSVKKPDDSRTRTDEHLSVDTQESNDSSLSLDVKILSSNIDCKKDVKLFNDNADKEVPSTDVEREMKRKMSFGCEVVPLIDLNEKSSKVSKLSLLSNLNNKNNQRNDFKVFNRLSSYDKEISDFQLSNKRLKIVSNKRKLKNNFQKFSEGFNLVPCLDGTVDEQTSSLSSNDNDENVRHKKKKLKIGGKQNNDRLSEQSTPTKRRYERLDLIIKKSPKLSSKVKVVVNDINSYKSLSNASKPCVKNVKSMPKIKIERSMRVKKLQVKISKVNLRSDKNVSESLVVTDDSVGVIGMPPSCCRDATISSEPTTDANKTISDESLVSDVKLKPCYVLLRKEDRVNCEETKSTCTNNEILETSTSTIKQATDDDSKIVTELRVSLTKVCEDLNGPPCGMRENVTECNVAPLLLDVENESDELFYCCNNEQRDTLQNQNSSNDNKITLHGGDASSLNLHDEFGDVKRNSSDFLTNDTSDDTPLSQNVCKFDDEDIFISNDECDNVSSGGSSGSIFAEMHHRNKVRKTLKFSNDLIDFEKIEKKIKNIRSSSDESLIRLESSVDVNRLSLSSGNESVVAVCSNEITTEHSDDITENDDFNNGILSFYDKTVYFGEDDEVVDSDDTESIVNYEIFSSDSEKVINDDSSIMFLQKNNIDETLDRTVIIDQDVVYTPKIKPPSYVNVLQNLSKYNLTEVNAQEPFYSNSSDVTDGVEIGGVKLKLKSNSIDNLEEFKGSFGSAFESYKSALNDFCKDGPSTSSFMKKRSINVSSGSSTVIVPLKLPPSFSDAKKWLKVKDDLVENLNSSGRNMETDVNSKSFFDESDCSNSVKNIENSCLLPSRSDLLSKSSQIQSEPVYMSVAHSTPLSKNKTISLPIISPSCTPLVLDNNKSKSSLKKVNKRRRLSNTFKRYPVLPLIHEDGVSSFEKEEDDSGADESTVIKSQELGSSCQVSEESKVRIEAQLKNEWKAKKRNNRSSSGHIDGATPNSSSDSPFKWGIENLQDARSIVQHQFLTLLAAEIHVQTRGDLRPDPEHDPIRAIFYYISNDVPITYDKPTKCFGLICVGQLEKSTTVDFDSVQCVSDEHALFTEFINLVRAWDPDIFLGYEIEMSSWGYLIQRAYGLNMNLNIELSRVIGSEGQPKYEDDKGMLGGDSDELEVKLAGRIVLNVWRLLRHEVTLQSYTFESIMYHVLHRRIPLFTFRTLSNWWEHRSNTYKWMVVEHYMTRVKGVIQLLDQLDLIGRTSELARLFGIQFYEVLSRGSQYRVESMMLRMAKPQNYVAISPSVQQRAKMRAPESLPLIMEPQSRLYNDPVIVLDFQSLYPSMIIAYNYCYSTCLGRVEHLAKSEIFEFGCAQLRVPYNTILDLENDINYSPCGIAFVNNSVRKGVLPTMLEEILDTRLMVKKSLKENKGNKALERVLHNRQLGLKLIANVTYGYTAANFSGRMPSVEVGDSVVSKGRETLERAITMVSRNKKWGAQVVYGDTDSLFVLVPGKTRKQAFEIGAEIAEAVTNDNPKPVKLKLEKVYQPCILQTKKRYVGYMYESPDQETPVYDAKGIETVRRDGCPAVAKILEKTLRLLFETKDVSIVKRYVNQQFSKILTGRLSIQELTFAKEYRGAAGYRPTACVPALELAREWCSKDKRAEPRVGERVPYVIVSGHPGVSLIKLVRSPYALLEDPGLKINAEYYITRVIIPPLNRCFSLIGVNVSNWYTDLPRKYHMYLPTAVPAGIKKATISQYFATVNCVVCQKQTMTGVCDECQSQPQKLSTELAVKIHTWERKNHLTLKLCQSCCGRMDNTNCVSLDCPVLYKLHQTKRDLNQFDFICQLQSDYLTF